MEGDDVMEELKLIIAKNIAELRKKNGMTQAEFAEKLNYSDKAISKWERGESVPDIATLKQIAVMFGVTIDYLLEEDHTKADALIDSLKRDRKRNHIIITMLSFMLVWLLATIIYVSLTYIPDLAYPWHAYIYALPISLVVLLVFNCIWGKRNWTFVLVSLLVWTILAATFVIGFGSVTWSVFLIGIPAQIIVLLWSHIRLRKKQL